MLSEWHRAQAWFDWFAWLDSALAGMAAPWIICTALVLTTLLLEDLAIAAGVAVAAQGSLSWGLAFTAVAAGIAAGDIGLYALGLATLRAPRLWRRFVPERSGWARGLRAREELLRRLPTAVLLARVIPGLRLLTYTACGFLRIPLLPFAAWVSVAVLLWTAGLFWLSAAIGEVLAAALGLPLPVAVALPVVALAAAFPLLRAARTRLQRRTS